MSDIVERLRDHATDWNGAQMPDIEPAKGDPTAGTLREAAAEITRLRADLAAAQEREQRIREALETARGLYQVTHIHAAIDAALGEPQ